VKVKELIKLLNDLPPEALVVLSKDAEGNGYSPLATDGLGLYQYVANCTWAGEIYPTDEEEGEEAVVLWPTN